MIPHSRDTKCPGFASIFTPEERGRRECRMLAAPMARLQQGKQAAVTTGKAGTTGIPCATVLRLIARSPRGARLDSPRRFAKRLAELDASVGAPGPHAFAVRAGNARL